MFIFIFLLGKKEKEKEKWPPVPKISSTHTAQPSNWQQQQTFELSYTISTFVAVTLLDFLPFYSSLLVWLGTPLLNQWRSRPLYPSSPPKSWLSLRSSPKHTQTHTVCFSPTHNDQKQEHISGKRLYTLTPLFMCACVQIPMEMHTHTHIKTHISILHPL